jgi:hypothetical protein
MCSGQAESGGSSSTESSSLSGGLRFGQKIYFEDGSGSRSKNRVNTVRKSSTTARCQVEGCRMDLSNVKAYYSRHKVCCIHSKSSKVIVSGLHQRFCQQCSRFPPFFFFLLFTHFAISGDRNSSKGTIALRFFSGFMFLLSFLSFGS